MENNTLFGKDVSRREAMKTTLKASAYAAPVILGIAQPVTALAQAVSGITSACTRPLTRGLAPSGSGTAGTSQTTTNCGGGFIQTFQVTLTGAPANTRYDVYLDQNSNGSAASHLFAGSFTTDAAGNAIFSASIRVPTAVTTLDNEIVLYDPTRSNYTSHQFFQDSFAPCPVACPPLPAGAAITGAPLTGNGTAVDAKGP